ncbi:MAG: Uma2 family endonuclease [Dehalococcoidia bacterium]|nr:Uma2 family endonuclease [Dehalococcoidia bacterium]
MIVVTKQGLTLAEFLALPEEDETLEFVDGEVIEKVSPKTRHSILQREIIRQVMAAESTVGFEVLPEARFVFGSPTRAYVPDLSIVDVVRLPVDEQGRFADDLELAPDIAIEILSPGQSAGHLLDKLAFYMANAVGLGVVVDPERERVIAYRPGDEPRSLASPENLAFGPALPEFQLDLARLFRALRPSRD